MLLKSFGFELLQAAETLNPFFTSWSALSSSSLRWTTADAGDTRPAETAGAATRPSPPAGPTARPAPPPLPHPLLLLLAPQPKTLPNPPTRTREPLQNQTLKHWSNCGTVLHGPSRAGPPGAGGEERFIRSPDQFQKKKTVEFDFSREV